MKGFLRDFLKRGLIAFGFGPIVMAIVYLCLSWSGVEDALTLQEVGTQVILVSLMAFFAAGITAIYQVERLPLPFAIIIQCAVLYVDYISVYLINGWLQNAFMPIMVFSITFVISFAIIWIITYFINKRATRGLNERLKNK